MITREMQRQIEERLNSINWAHYTASAIWAGNNPSCSLYEGRRLCDYWRRWIVLERVLYSDTNKGEQQYIEGIQQRVHQLKRKDIVCTLEEAKKSPLPEFFWNVERERYGSVEKAGRK